MRKKKTAEEYIADIKGRGIKVTPIEDYKGSVVKINHKWDSCGHVTSICPNNVLNGNGCNICKRIKQSQRNRVMSKGQRLPIDSLQIVLENTHGRGSISIINPDDYSSNSSKLKLLCREGHVWEASFNSLQQGKG